MSWKTVSTVMIIVAVLVLVQSVIAGPLMSIQQTFNESGDYDNTGEFDGNELMGDLPGAWFSMGLVAIFGMMVWGIARIVRRQLTQGRI